MFLRSFWSVFFSFTKTKANANFTRFLFSGSISWSKAFAELPDWECISIDNDAKFTEATIVCDVLEWKVPERLHGSVGVVAIGVPCTAYSTADKKKSEEKQEATRVL